MDINETMAREIAQQLGIGGGGARADQDMIRRLEGKSDAELMQELARLQSQLAANNIGPAQQKALVKSLMPMMKGPQPWERSGLFIIQRKERCRQRLQQLLQMLGE